MLGSNLIGSKGWLGNQMFQYASLKGIASNRGFSYTVPPMGSGIHNYSLFETFRMTGCKWTGMVNYPVYQAKFEFDEYLFNDIPDDRDIVGFLQSEKYFESIKDDVVKDFTFKQTYDLPFENYTAVHVRRGDYLWYPDHHPAQQREWYKKAIKMVDDGPIIIFSDDIEWCRQNIDADYYSEDSEQARDLYLMTMAKNNIISNSSFSWWGAWLNANPDQLVIAPKQWFGPALSYIDTSDICPERWLRM